MSNIDANEVISLDLNFKLYQQLVEIYNIPQDDYAPEYIFELNHENIDTLPPVPGRSYYYPIYSPPTLIDSSSLNEKALMHLLFSKYTSDKTLSTDTQKYTDYILRQFYNFQSISTLVPTYYEDDFIVVKDSAKPYTKADIIDFDISQYASQNVRYYLFYLDIISQIYRHAYTKKANKETFPEASISVKSRYYIDSTFIAYCEPYTINLTLTIQGYDNRIVDISNVSTTNKTVNNAFDLFKTDILRHLTYLSGEDVKLTGLAYLKTVEYFYKFCRLRLMYLIAHSIKLLSVDIEAFITDEILAVFTNFREKLNVEILQSEDFKMSKNMLYNKNVLDTSTKLSDINKQLLENRDRILSNQSLYEYIDLEYAKIYNTHIVATILLFVVIFVSIILFASKLYIDTKAFVSLSMTVILVVLIVILYAETGYKTTKKIVEKFENSYEAIRYPRERLTGATTVYKIDGTIVKVMSNIDGQTATNCSFNVFNQKGTITCTTNYDNWFKNIRYKWIAIDLGEYIIPKSFQIESDSANNFPKQFKLYGSKIDKQYDAKDNTWKVIYDSTNDQIALNSVSPVLTYDVDNEESYRFFLLDIRNDVGNREGAIIKHWHLNATRSYKEITLTSTLQNVNMGQNLVFEPLELPNDYDDNNLIDWDLNVVASESSTECISLSIGTFCFNNTNSINQTENSALDPYGSQYITANISAKKQSLTGVKYYLKIRYFPRLFSEDQSSTLSKFAAIADDTAAARADMQLAQGALTNSCNIWNASNENISFLITRLYDKMEESNAIYAYLAEATLYSNIQSEINTSNRILNTLELTSNSLFVDITTLQKNLKQAMDAYSISSNIYNSLLSDYAELQKNSGQTLHLLRNFIDDSQEELLSNIETKINERNMASLESDVNKLESIAFDSQILLSCNILLEESRLQTELSAKRSARAKFNTSASYLIAETKHLELENSRKQIAITGADRLKTQFEEQVSNELEKTASNDLEVAKRDRQAVEAEALLQLGAYNEKYNTKFTSLDDLNTYLNDMYKRDKSDRAAIDREMKDIIYRNNVAKITLNNAYAIRSFYSALSQQTDASITYYDGVIQEYETLLGQYGDLKAARTGKLEEAQGLSVARISTALQKYTNVDDSTLKDILQLKEAHSKLVMQIFQRKKEESVRYKAQLQCMEKRKTAEKTYEAIVKQKEAEIANSNYYKTIRDAIKDDVNVSMIIRDIDVIILYSISDNINGINYDLITPNMSSEYFKFDEYNKSIKLSAYKSDFDLNNKILSIRDMEAKTVLFLNLALVVMVCMTIYYYFSSEIAAIIALITIIISIIIYSVKTRRPVRNRAKNYYWN